VVELVEERPDLLPREDDGQVRRPLGAHELAELADLAVEDVPVEKEERGERLRLRRGADLLVHGQVGDEGVDLRLGHLGGVTQPVEADVPPRPHAVGPLSAAAVVTGAQGVLHLDDELGHMPQCDRGATEFNG
jgi:hypothetical protein